MIEINIPVTNKRGNIFLISFEESFFSKVLNIKGDKIIEKNKRIPINEELIKKINIL